MPSYCAPDLAEFTIIHVLYEIELEMSFYQIIYNTQVAVTMKYHITAPSR